MFGEEVSESPRAPSPWNNLVATPPASSPHLKAITGGELTRIPKLIPEVEEGNVEYKLKLCTSQIPIINEVSAKPRITIYK